MGFANQNYNVLNTIRQLRLEYLFSFFLQLVDNLVTFDIHNLQATYRLIWLFRGFLAPGYIARYIWLHSPELYSHVIHGNTPHSKMLMEKLTPITRPYGLQQCSATLVQMLYSQRTLQIFRYGRINVGCLQRVLLDQNCKFVQSNWKKLWQNCFFKRYIWLKYLLVFLDDKDVWDFSLKNCKRSPSIGNLWSLVAFRLNCKKLAI